VSARERGEPGWRDQKGVQENIDHMKQFMAGAHVPKKGAFLALGCGAGNNVLWLADEGFEIHGIDISPTAIAWANEKAKEQNVRADFQVGSVLDLKEYADDFFDVVLDDACLHCIIGDDRRLCLASVHRVLKRGGVFHVQAGCDGPGPGWKAAVAQGHFVWDSPTHCMLLRGAAWRYLGPAEAIMDEVRSAGFQIMQWAVIDTSNDQHLILDAMKR
jgi:SAM-dependent methyltransferase